MDILSLYPQFEDQIKSIIEFAKMAEFNPNMDDLEDLMKAWLSHQINLNNQILANKDQSMDIIKEIIFHS